MKYFGNDVSVVEPVATNHSNNLQTISSYHVAQNVTQLPNAERIICGK